MLGEAICKGYFYSWPDKLVIYSKLRDSESVSSSAVDFIVLV